MGSVQFHGRTTRKPTFLSWINQINIGATSKPTLQQVAYPGYGFQLPDGRWQVTVAGVVWQLPVIFNRRQKLLIKMLGGMMQATPQDLESELFLERVTPFLTDCEPRPRLVVRFGDTVFELEKKTKRDGRYEESFLLDAETVAALTTSDSKSISFSVSLVQESDPSTEIGPIAESKISLIPRTGISIVTDIDDTIKDSSVGNRRELLHNTFLRDFKSVPHMAETYRDWHDLGSQFHYVSASPWQLFESLNRFLELDRFPQGTLHLRNFRLRDQLLKKVIIHRKGKRFAIQRLIRTLPGRRFILVGDSGEKDPEIYQTICKKFPSNIAGMFIRDVAHNPISAERWRKISADLPEGLCQLFHDGEDLRAKAASLF